jgi:4-diphosphocytidyl-2-C-methyl-D-erythritol kinase
MMIKAYGKINVALNILGKTDDGYHEIDTIILPVALHDSIEVVKLPSTYETFVTCDEFDLSEAHYNIVRASIELLRKTYNFKDNFRVKIYKRIPIAGGLGGGSADAAAVMRAINKMLNLNASDQELFELAKRLGTDVPFFVFNKGARCRGKGDDVSYLESYTKYNVLIIKPEKGLCTPDVYKEADSCTLVNTNIDMVVQALEQGNDSLFASSMSNALTLPAKKLLPELSDIISEIKSEGFDKVQLTGSGSCVFVLSRSKRELYKLMKEFYAKHYVVELTKII